MLCTLAVGAGEVIRAAVVAAPDSTKESASITCICILVCKDLPSQCPSHEQDVGGGGLPPPVLVQRPLEHIEPAGQSASTLHCGLPIILLVQHHPLVMLQCKNILYLEIAPKYALPDSDS